MMSLWAARLKPLVRHVRDIPMSTGPCRFCPSTALRGFATIEHCVGWVRDLAADAELTDQQMTTKSSKSSRPRGRPFQKGVSGNPSGRPAKPIEQRAIEIDVRRYAKGFGREMVDKLVELARGKLNIGEDNQGNAKYMPVRRSSPPPRPCLIVATGGPLRPSSWQAKTEAQSCMRARAPTILSAAAWRLSGSAL
jgi:hypothetical protein